jgi:hypothetical protein
VGEAFDGIDEYCWACVSEDGDAPDAALDCVWMMREDDWAALRSVWSERPAPWREGCAYILVTHSNTAGRRPT